MPVDDISASVWKFSTFFHDIRLKTHLKVNSFIYLGSVKDFSKDSNKTSPAPPPAPAVHDPYAEIAMGPDKPKIPELKV